ncbi:MAG: phosphatase PAP2 family protein [Prevotella sp.]|nr:phosphatase PAP2 family protein [Prevotella sp.]
MDIDSLIQLDRELLLFFNGSQSLYLDGLVKTLTTAATWIPLYLALFYIVVKNNDSMPKILLVVGSALLCVLLAGTIDDEIVKPTVARWRPTHDGVIGSLVDTYNGYRGGSYGFFSAHASNTFSLAIFFSLLVRSRLLTVFLVAWSLTNCWTRMYLGVHFPGDIMVGLLWGGIVGTAVYMLYRRMYRRLSTGMSYVSSHYTSTGYQLADADVVATVLILTFIYALLKACLALYA